MQTHKKLKVRILSLILSVLMVFTLFPSTAFGVEDALIGEGNVIECHPVHDEDCGYIEAVEERECSHLNGDGRYSCAPIEEASPSNAEKEYVCNHKDACGYTEVIEGTPCLHNCDLEQCKEIPLTLQATLPLDGVIRDFTSLSNAISNASSDSTNPTDIEIGADINLTSALTLNGKYVRLTSSGDQPYTLTRASNFSGIPFTVSGGGTLELQNIILDGNKSNVSSAGVLVKVDSSKLTLETGAVLQNNKNSAINITKTGALVTMNDGKITENAVAGNGGAVSFSNSAAMHFIMNGGEISDNTATGNGSAIYDSGYDTNPTIVIAGGEIKNNTANGKYGGAIYSNCTLRISGGIISDNAAPNGKSGGIYKTSSGGFTMTGGTIMDNTAGAADNGENVYIVGTLNIGEDATIPSGLVVDVKLENLKYISILSPLTGEIGIKKFVSSSTSAKVGDILAAGTGYTIDASDVACFSYEGDAFGFKLDTAANQIKLAVPDGVPEADTSKKRIYARGTALILAAGSSNVNHTVIYLDKNANGTIDGNDVIWAHSGMDNTQAGNNLPGYDFIGGSYNEDLTGPTKITMLGGNVKSIFAGGSSGKVTGDTAVTVSGGTVGGSVYGGGLYGVVDGDTSVTVSGGVIESDVFGGGQGNEQDNALSGNTSVSITGGKVRMVYGGGSYKTDAVTSTTILISGGEIMEDVYGGGVGAAVAGQTEITVTDGNIKGCIYGSTYQAGTIGSTAISITGGTVEKSVYSRYSSATVTGDKAISIGGTARIGSASASDTHGIYFNGGSTTNGVTRLAIASPLEVGASVNIYLPSGFNSASNPVIATEAVSGDNAKLNLVGSGASGLETYFDSSDDTIKVRFTESVSKVTVSPEKWIIRPGLTKKYTATVEGTGNPAQTVTWSVSGNGDAGTSIDNEGLLTVASGETADTLTVTATTTEDTNKSGMSTVILQKLTGVRVTVSPTKTTYVEGKSFDKTGMTVVADLVENAGNAYVEQVITDYTISPSGALSPNNTKVTVSYTVGNVTKNAEVSIIVNAKINAVAPLITTDLSTEEVTCLKDGTAEPLTIAASAADGGTLSYEWYSNTTGSTSGSEKLNVTEATYTPSTSNIGTTYYYCVVTNTIADNSDGGIKTAATTSSIAKMVVFEKKSITITGLSAAVGLTYNGNAQAGYIGTVTVQDNKVPVDELVYTYSGMGNTIYNSNTAPTKAGAYKLVVTVADSNKTYSGTHTDIFFTIGKATVTITADNKSVYVGDAKPILTYTATGLASGDILATAPILGYESEPDMSKAGAVKIKAGGAVVPNTDNYESTITYVDGTLTISARSSGGGGSSSSSGQTILTSVPPAYTGGTKIIGNVRVPDYTIEGNWKKNENGTWTFAGNTRQTYRNTWAPVFNPYADVTKGQSAFDWFMFDANGIMMTGWYTDVDGNTYYLNPNSDNTLGAMQTGWVLIDGKHYYFNEMPDGIRGTLFRNARTPDGYRVDENGVWDGNEM